MRAPWPMRRQSAPVVVDCITLWLSNMMLGQHDIDAAVARFIKMPRRAQSADHRGVERSRALASCPRRRLAAPFATRPARSINTSR